MESILAAGKTVGDYIVENPGRTALYAAQGVAIIAPSVVFTPVLGAVGFGVAGPIANSIAAGCQTATTATGSIFAVAQSAAMGGAGTATAGLITQGVIVGGNAVVRGGQLAARFWRWA
ncbi:hypothetical protein EJ05DRAFT_474907 [Pseudovirgaria hyperparasitica]|uniref:Uncharacterized protein n=1 Tax=Pseudovirgaria hyperparasitica TaxID=470096 RepID=A0A6A6WD20_9PEZI|nr:uncharacterized protein EJ05DRAFT_474907 [Pseudovirgaria hyperparasitica]KAF2759860.1 hypothetical protein EJ05DRAFT_474907 [Pseudovirgaria hyperparasitica]